MLRKKYSYPSVLTIAGFDGSGGAGIQADIKTISALGCFATSVLTALPVQNTCGVRSIFPIDVNVVQAQIECIMDDIIPDAIKIGMVHTPELVNVIVNTLTKYPKVPIVFDPVMVATSGHNLIEQPTIDVLIKKLIPFADIITPNMDEVGILTDSKIHTLAELELAAKQLDTIGSKYVLLKGGHLTTSQLTSILLRTDGKRINYTFPKINTNNTHGSGCTLSSAIASYLAQGKTMEDAVDLAQIYVFNAIKNGADVKIGKGNGPLDHFFNPKKLIKNELVK